MKKIFFAVAILVVALATTGCTKLLLSEPRGSDASLAQVEENVDALDVSLKGLYSIMYTGSDESDTEFTSRPGYMIEGQKYIDVMSDMLASDAACSTNNFRWLTNRTYMDEYLSLSDFTNTLIFNTQRGEEENVKKILTENSAGVTSFASKKDTLKVYESRMKSSRFMLQMFIYLALFSGVILIYNISLISIRERKTEFATMKIMGVSDGELKQMIFVEQAVYLIAGLILSIPLVRLFKWILETLLVSDSYTLKLHITVWIYICSLLFCILMLFISGRAILRTINKINPNDSLKERG